MMGVDPSGKSTKAILKLFRESGTEMREFRKNNEWSWWKNDWDPDLNNYYAKSELNGLWFHGQYDLVYGGNGIQDKFDPDDDGNVVFDGEQINLGEISNVLTALNSQRLGFSQEHMETWAMITVKLGLGNGVDGEMADRELYNYGYYLGEIEKNDGVITDEQIIRGVKRGVEARRKYVSSH